ncbi:amidohydrolase 3 [Elsinoe ampelina]|uniref:Amidohydrolase 3 n=1 Tax=Elsinoe ampelina TaxID=302913 RepID=A0A6A6FZH3_9PEZI|nr:amidohydrolase 3 [Elsinoe ampelina]
MKVLTNGKFVILDGEGASTKERFVDCMVVTDGNISWIGNEDDSLKPPVEDNAEVVTMNGKVIVPGFIDGHMHLLLLGQSLTKLDLSKCRSLGDIRASIKQHATEHPDLPRIMCKGWLESSVEGHANRSMLDDLDPRPIFIDSNGLHQAWCNTAALKELDLKDMPDPPGGVIHRDSAGDATGLLSEAAVLNLIWPFLSASSSLEQRKEAILSAISAYTRSGYTGVTEMAMDEYAWEALLSLQQTSPLPIHISAYWLIRPAADIPSLLLQVDRAAALAKQYNSTTSPDMRVVGIKLILDGTVDACTAALSSTYAAMTSLVLPLWTKPHLEAVVVHAAQSGLQIALHAIGDHTVKMAIDALEAHGDPTNTGDRRHRIEHLELTSPEDAARLGKLGITASIQPVHADPAILRAWPKLIGEHRCSRAFAYADFERGGATLAMGSDSRTAPWDPLKNMYVATTRKSARQEGLRAPRGFKEEWKLSLASALAASTRGAAFGTFQEGMVGSLKPGMKADFVVLDVDWSASGMREANVVGTWLNGRRV